MSFVRGQINGILKAFQRKLKSVGYIRFSNMAWMRKGIYKHKKGRGEGLKSSRETSGPTHSSAYFFVEKLSCNFAVVVVIFVVYV